MAGNSAEMKVKATMDNSDLKKNAKESKDALRDFAKVGDCVSSAHIAKVWARGDLKDILGVEHIHILSHQGHFAEHEFQRFHIHNRIA